MNLVAESPLPSHKHNLSAHNFLFEICGSLANFRHSRAQGCRQLSVVLEISKSGATPNRTFYPLKPTTTNFDSITNPRSPSPPSSSDTTDKSVSPGPGSCLSAFPSFHVHAHAACLSLHSDRPQFHLAWFLEVPFNISLEYRLPRLALNHHTTIGHLNAYPENEHLAPGT